MKYDQAHYTREAVKYGLPLEDCAGPAYPNHSQPCPNGIKVRLEAGWCYECLPRTQIVESK